MRCKLYSLLLTFFLASLTFGQQRRPECLTGVPGKAWQDAFNQFVDQAKKARNGNFLTTNEPITIPVVVHVLHWEKEVGEKENISAEQIRSQIVALNKFFSGSQDYSPLPAEFNSVTARNTGIQFCLAKVDELGNVMAEEGIVRVDASRDGWVLDTITKKGEEFLYNLFEFDIKPKTIWNPRRYLNIWVAAFSENIVYGWANYPLNSTLNGIPYVETGLSSGIVMTTRAFGTIGDLNPLYNLGGILVHETGHWLGLRHIWGDEKCGNDFCDDTPIQRNATYECPLNIIQACDGSGPIMTMNFMDYTPNACMYMFTNDQLFRMRQAMEFGTFRKPLITSNACTIPNPIDLGLIAYYPFNGNAADESGYGNTGDVRGVTFVSDRRDNANSAAEFNGQQWIEANDSKTLDIDEELTISLWMYQYQQASPRGFRLVEKQSAGIADGFTFDTQGDGSGQNLRFCPGGCSSDGVSPTPIPVEEWVHVAVTYNRGITKFYINGVLDRESNLAPSMPLNDLKLMLGTSQGAAADPSEKFIGKMDEVRIYRRALEQSEILNLVGNQALPVNLTAFQVQQTDCGVINVSWVTAQEQNNRGFEVQASRDGSTFSAAKFVYGKGNSSQVTSYQSVLYNLAPGNIYIRLKQIDHDNQVRYSEVRKMNIRCNEAAVKLVPNPSQGQFRIEGISVSRSHSVTITDMQGRRLYETRLSNGNHSLDVEHLPKGIYVVCIDGEIFRKLIIH